MHALRVHWLLVILAIFAMLYGVVLLRTAVLAQQDCHGAMIPDTALCLLECTPSGICWIPSGGPPLVAFTTYVNEGFWRWAFAIGIGIAVLNGTIAGFQITIWTLDQAQYDKAKTRFFWSVMGLLILLLAGTILSFINPIGFQPG